MSFKTNWQTVRRCKQPISGLAVFRTDFVILRQLWQVKAIWPRKSFHMLWFYCCSTEGRNKQSQIGFRVLWRCKQLSSSGHLVLHNNMSFRSEQGWITNWAKLKSVPKAPVCGWSVLILFLENVFVKTQPEMTISAEFEMTRSYRSIIVTQPRGPVLLKDPEPPKLVLIPT